MHVVQMEPQAGTEEAAILLGISGRRLREWIGKKRIPEAPTMRQGKRLMRYFTPEYMVAAIAKTRTPLQEVIARLAVSTLAETYRLKLTALLQTKLSGV